MIAGMGNLLPRLFFVTLALVCMVTAPALATNKTTLSAAKTVLGSSSYGNVLKSVAIAYDRTTDDVYASGILTGHVAVVESRSGLLRTFNIRSDTFQVLKPVMDETRGRLWHVGSKATKLYLSAPRASGAGLLASASIHGDLTHTYPATTDYPLGHAAVDSNTGWLWFTLADSTGRQKYLVAYKESSGTLQFQIQHALSDAVSDMQWAPDWPCRSGVTGALAALHRNGAAGSYTYSVVFYDTSSGTPVSQPPVSSSPYSDHSVGLVKTKPIYASAGYSPPITSAHVLVV